LGWSTGKKNVIHSDVIHVETLIGAQTVSTVPEATLKTSATTSS
jgi:hypothetical protein